MMEFILRSIEFAMWSVGEVPESFKLNDPLYKEGVKAGEAAARKAIMDGDTYGYGVRVGAASRDAEVQRLQFALADSEALELGTAERCDQLRAQINVLRDAFQTFIDEHEECQDADEWMAELCSIEALHVAGEALASTPEQSLAEYRNKVIEQMIACYSPDDSAHDYFDKLNALKDQK